MARSPAAWDVPDDDARAEPGTVEVTGTAAMLNGGEVAATATVVVDELTSTLPARAKAYAGGTPALPTTVTAVAAGGAEVQRPVVWTTPPRALRCRRGRRAHGHGRRRAGATLPATARGRSR